MIESKGKKYYTTYELKDIINDPDAELHKLWFKKMPHSKNVVYIEQVSRVLYEGKKNNQISFAEYTRSEKGTKKYFAFLLEDVIEYVKIRETYKHYNVKIVERSK